MKTASVLIVDDHPLMRLALRMALEDQPGLQVVGEAGSVAECKAIALMLAPDLILLDLFLPDGSGLALIHFRNEALPQARILVVTSSDNEHDIIAAVEAGAEGYVVKDSPPEHLQQAVQAVLAGEGFLTLRATGVLLKRLRQPERKNNAAESNLSGREIEILQHLAGGATNTEIAAALYISESTVRSHFQRMLKKLGLQNRSQAMVYTIKNLNTSR